MDQNANFDRQYLLSAGKAGEVGFEIGESSAAQPVPLHVNFSFQKSDLKTQNTGKLSIWNLNKEHLAMLEQDDCSLAFRAGYGSRRPLIFAGIVTYCVTSLDGADRKTEIEVVDNLVEVRDTFISVSYNGPVNWKTIFDDACKQMGVAVVYSYNATFVDVSNGYSFIGYAKDLITKGCDCCGLTWSIQNGVMHIKRPGDVLDTEVYVLSAETGLVGIPARVCEAASETATEKQIGWDVTYLMNAAINIDDYVRLESEAVSGYFRVYSIQIEGDNVSGDWVCTARLLLPTNTSDSGAAGIKAKTGRSEIKQVALR